MAKNVLQVQQTNFFLQERKCGHYLNFKKETKHINKAHKKVTVHEMRQSNFLPSITRVPIK